jgi:hypothetical protein
LAEAAYAVLLAARRELHVEEVDFVLEQLNYRFNSDSLAHHLRGYTSNRWNSTSKSTARIGSRLAPAATLATHIIRRSGYAPRM